MSIRFSRGVALAVLLLAALVGAAPARSDAATPYIRTLSTNSAFSPNHDGVKDYGLVTYQLASPSYVWARVTTSNGRYVTSRYLGHATRGAHTYVWNGYTAGRRLAYDGTYVVTLSARHYRHSPTHTTRGTLVLDARYGSLGLGLQTLSSTVVYPRTTAIHDVVVGDFTLFGRRPDPSLLRWQLLSGSGRLLDSSAMTQDCAGCQGFTYTWDGRDAAGAALPAGTYRIRVVQGRDGAGNLRILVPLRTVIVSDAALVAKTTTVSLVPQQTLTRDECDLSGSNGCSDYECGTAESDRFPDGFSYRSVLRPNPSQGEPGIVCNAGDEFLLPVGGRSTPYDTFSVTATGGPTTPGDDDTATLSAWSNDGLGNAEGKTATLQGDTSATISDIHSLWMTDPILASPYYNPPDARAIQGPVLLWKFGTGNYNAYDVAAFEVTYTRYALP